MRVRAALLATGLVLAACTPRESEESVRATIVRSERDWGGVFVSGDVATMDRLVADDFVGVSTKGVRYTKADLARSLKTEPLMTADVLGPVTVRVYGDTAVAQGSERELGPAPDRKPQDRIWTDVWVKRDGHWRIVAAQDADPALR